MKDLNLMEQYKSIYSAKSSPTVVQVPKMHYLALDGHGDPNKIPLFQMAVEALFSVSYTIKFMAKKGAIQIDYKVMPLEGLWWCQKMEDFTVKDKTNWDWTLMILQPDFVTKELLDEAKEAALKKKANSSITALQLINFEEGSAVQLLHTGPYSAEAANIKRIHSHIVTLKGKLSGKHHEIYLSDMRRTAPEKLKTIIRQPFTAG
jgi:hypothetical protein